MKTILSGLVALSVIAGAAGTASALDAKTFSSRLTAITTDDAFRCGIDPFQRGPQVSAGPLLVPLGPSSMFAGNYAVMRSGNTMRCQMQLESATPKGLCSPRQ
jgi:hypothetical protein